MMQADDDFAGRHIVLCNWRDSTHPQAGGAEMYCEQVARELQGRGAQVTYLTARSAGAAKRQRADFGTVIRLGGTFTTYARVMLWLATHRRSIDGVIDSENGIPYFSALAVRRATPVVLVIHHVHQAQFALYFPPVLAGVGRQLEKWGARVVYGRRPVCVVSPSARSEVRKQLAFRGPVYIAPNGVNALDVPEDVERSPGPTIVCVGRLVTHKRLDLMVDAVAGLVARWPDLQVHLVGDGEARWRLERQAERLGLGAHLTFHGRVPDAQRNRLMATAWMTVNTTAGEGWGLSVVEAAAQGVPAVAYRVPGMQDSVLPGITGWLLDDGDDLADAVDGALHDIADPQVATVWAAHCRDWAGAFTWEATAERLLAILTSERDRLGGGLDERRRRSDATTVVELPGELVGTDLIGRLRRTDQIRTRDGSVQLLLNSGDEHDAAKALHRVGVPSDAAEVRTRVARHFDLLGWVARNHFEVPPRLRAVPIDEPRLETVAGADPETAERPRSGG